MIGRLCLTAALGLAPLVTAAEDASKAASAPATASPQPDRADGPWVYLRVPFFSEEFASVPAAMVDDQVITVKEVTDALAGAHGARKDEQQAGKTDVMPILDRVIDVRLVCLEARNMGMEDLPEVKKAVADFEENTGRELLKERVAREVKADPAVVDRLYRDTVRQWKVRSLLFANESDAIRLKSAVDGGKSFDEVAKQAVADGKAKGGDEPQALTRDKALPHVVAVLEKAKPGEVSAPLKLQEGWAILKLEEVLYPDDAKARASAQRVAHAEALKEALRVYYEGIAKRFATIDQKLLKSLDFEARKPGMAALKKDRRVLAHIRGAKAITVADLASGLEEGFFHGVADAIKKKSVNRQKLEVFDGLLSKRVVPLEAKRLGIDASPELARRVETYRSSVLFSTFIGQVIAPKIQVTDEVARKYYEEHKKEYAYPAFYKLESLAFPSAKEAQAAVDKLESGTDFKWLNANSNQIKPAERKARLDGTLSQASLPKELAAALAGAKAGDHRLYADPSSQFYTVHVVDVVPAKEQPFEEVQPKIREHLFYEQLNAAVKEWAGKLRKASDVKVFITKVGS